jgi:hypothetical protein
LSVSLTDTLMHGAPNYTPHQIWEAGQQAEATHRFKYAVQFYQHLTEHYSQTPEAAYARDRLAQIAAHSAQPGQSDHPVHDAPRTRDRGSRSHTGGGATQVATTGVPGLGVPAIARHGDETTAHRGPRAAHAVAKRGTSHDPRNHNSTQYSSKSHYPLGRMFARGLSLVGWLALLVGVAGGLATGAILYGILPVATLGIGAVVVPFAWPALGAGVVLILVGAIARASFDTADATRELVELARGNSSVHPH